MKPVRFVSCVVALKPNVISGSCLLFLCTRKLSVQAETSSQSQVATHSLLHSIIGTKDPLILTRWTDFKSSLPQPKTAWIDQLATEESGYPTGLLNLHPDVWATYPRIDLLKEVVNWQEEYRKVEWNFVPNRGELPGGGRKPWPQKGTGWARQGSDRAPQWRGGGKCFGPRGPMAFYKPMDKAVKAHALRVALTCKYLQDDVKFVTDYSSVASSSHVKFLSAVRETRNWGHMALFVGLKEMDELPEPFRQCVSSQPDVHYLRVSMLSAQALMTFPTVVMDVAALDEIEARLLFHIHRFSDQSTYPGAEAVLDFVKHYSSRIV